jgi:hypothetical protein
MFTLRREAEHPSAIRPSLESGVDFVLAGLPPASEVPCTLEDEARLEEIDPYARVQRGAPSRVRAFRALHERARRGQLTANERESYDGARTDIAQLLGRARRHILRPEETWRTCLGVIRAVHVHVELDSGTVATLTTEISLEGITTIFDRVIPAGVRVPIRLLVDPTMAPISARGRVARSGVVPRRLFLVFEELDESARMRIEDVVFDTVYWMLSGR